MGSKNQPSRFDCYAKLEPDEPYFVLMGRDRTAAIVVTLWAAIRRELDESDEKVNEAFDCAAAMASYVHKLGKKYDKNLDRALITAFAKMQAAIIRGEKPK